MVIQKLNDILPLGPSPFGEGPRVKFLNLSTQPSTLNFLKPLND
jgi:hypothetical protein